MVVFEIFGSGEQFSDEPDVVLDHSYDQIHLGPFRSSRDPKATWWMEMHVVLRGKLDLARHVTPDRWGHAIGPAEGPREGLVRGITRLHCDLEYPI